MRTAKTKGAAPPVTKICSKCKQTKVLGNYYSNRDWVEQLGKDVWCKDCVTKCATKDELREYYWENNREWNDKLWAGMQKKAELILNKNTTYQNAFEDTKKGILDRLTCQKMIKSMQINYKFEDHSNDMIQSYQEAKQEGMVKEDKPETPDPNVKTFSEFFNGYFKPEELKYLEDYYQQLENDFELSDVNLRDTAKKLAKQSLICDRVQDKYAAGQATLADVRDAMTLFDLLSKSGNFSASKRKPGDKAGMGSWSELTFQLESTGHPCTRKIEWPKDDVDKTIEEFRYIVQSLGLDGI